MIRPGIHKRVITTCNPEHNHVKILVRRVEGTLLVVDLRLNWSVRDPGGTHWQAGELVEPRPQGKIQSVNRKRRAHADIQCREFSGERARRRLPFGHDVGAHASHAPPLEPGKPIIFFAAGESEFFGGREMGGQGAGAGAGRGGYQAKFNPKSNSGAMKLSPLVALLSSAYALVISPVGDLPQKPSPQNSPVSKFSCPKYAQIAQPSVAPEVCQHIPHIQPHCSFISSPALHFEGRGMIPRDKYGANKFFC